MTTILEIILCIGVPIVASWLFLAWSKARLEAKPMIAASETPLKIFLWSRFVFHSAFGILIATFLYAIASYGLSGEQTRLIVATAPVTEDLPIRILSDWSNIILPLLFLSIFIALFALGMIGKNVLRMMPQDGKPGVEFSGFRFTFLMMAMSLIMPPLVFGSLLLV